LFLTTPDTPFRKIFSASFDSSGYSAFELTPLLFKAAMPKEIALNVLGQPLVACSFEPLTGFFRDGCCKTDENDLGRHLVCAIMTEEFLQFSLEQGNDLITPRPEYQFPGLFPGDQWCLCISRWGEALTADCAPQIKLESTHINALKTVPLETLKRFAASA